MFQAQVKVDVSNLKEDIGRLKSQIVESPEELKSELEKMRETIKACKMSIVSLEKQLKREVKCFRNDGHFKFSTSCQILQMSHLIFI